MRETTCFLSYAREDLENARRLYDTLTAAGASVWFDKESLGPGERWQPAIRRGIHQSRYFLALLSSNSISKKGYVQRELKEAFQILDEYPDDEIYLIPVRIDQCKPTHDKLIELNWVDIFPDFNDGAHRIIRFLGLSRADPAVDVQQSLSDDDSDDFSIVRYNGVYRSRGSNYWSYLRFYEDGSVISVSTTGEPNEIRNWFYKDSKSHLSMGFYKTIGKEISFASSSSEGKVEYAGDIVGNRLILRIHSHINGYRSVSDYIFVKDGVEPPS